MQEEEIAFARVPERSSSTKTLSLIVGIESFLLVIFAIVIAVLVGLLLVQNNSSTSCECPVSSPSQTLSPTPSPTPGEIFFLEISDIHTDIHYSNASLPLGQYGRDGGFVLLNTTLENMVNLPTDTAFVLITGDFPSHSIPDENEHFLTISQVSSTIAAYFNDVPIYPALGNNDVYPDYYFPLNTTSSHWMDQLSDLWGTTLGWLSSEQLSTFNPNGYYQVDALWENGPRLIVLNTLLYSSRLIAGSDPLGSPTPPDQLPDDPKGQFAWLTGLLDIARSNGQQVVLQYHIPSGMNAYDNSMTWHEKFTINFDNICGEYSDVIMIHMAGHYHTDDFRLLSGPSGVLLTPSISPVHTNNPGFRQFVVQNGVISNYYQYFVDLVAGNAHAVAGEDVLFEVEYDLQSAYGVSSVDGSSVEQLIQLITSNAEYYMKFLTHEYVYYPLNRGTAVCAMTRQEQDDYFSCIDEYQDDEN